MKRKPKIASALEKLISGLSEGEIRNLKRYLRCFDPNFKENHEVKTIALLDAILSNKEQKSEESLVQGSEKFLRLRLEKKIHESLLLEVNTSAKGKYSPSANAAIAVRKKLIVAQLLWGRNLTTNLAALLEQLTRQCEKFELYSELIETLYLKQQFFGFRKGYGEFKKLEEHILIAEVQLAAFRKAKSAWTGFLLYPHPDPSVGKGLEAVISQLDSTPGIGECISIRYYYLLCKVALNRCLHRYGDAKLCCLELLALVGNYQLLLPPRRTGIILGLLAGAELRLGNFARTLELTRKARKQFTANSPNFNLILEIESLVLLALGENAQALDLIFPLAQTNMNSQNKVHIFRRRYIAAAAFFSLGQLRDSEEMLRSVTCIYGESESWNTNMRILRLIIQIESKEWDEAEQSLDSLRKQLERISHQEKCSPRTSLIFKILKSLVKNLGNFQDTQFHFQKEMELLNSGETGYKRNIAEGELIDVVQWLSLQTQSLTLVAVHRMKNRK